MTALTSGLPRFARSLVSISIASVFAASLLPGCASSSTSTSTTGVRTASMGSTTERPSAATPRRDATPPSVTMTRAAAEADEDVLQFDEHVRTLANPYFEGRVPGSRGIDRAAEYLAHYFNEYGLEPAFNGSHFQSFEFGTRLQTRAQSLSAQSPDGSMHFIADREFRATGLGGSGRLERAPLSFVGYAIENGFGGYSSFDDDTDLTGRVAMLMRFEPMDENGVSKWADGPRWTNATWFNNKLDATMKRNPAAIIIVNTPGADDPRNASLVPGGSGRSALDIPVFMMSTDAADELIRAADPEGRSLLEWRKLADRRGGSHHFDRVGISFEAAVEYGPNEARNVGAILPGRGALKDEFIVIGAHYDHLGMGTFGSRSGAGQLHPGADDNASGTSGVLLMAERLATMDRKDDSNTPRRSVLFIGFSAEESGLNGSKYYVEHPVVPMEQHRLMVNFDMIGRVDDNGMTVYGSTSAEGPAWSMIDEAFATAPFDVSLPNEISSRSDHAPFYGKGVPVLFASNGDLHDDYHTPGDVSWKINREGAVDIVDVFTILVPRFMSTTSEWTFAGDVDDMADDSGGPRMGGMRIRFGISPGSYEDNEMGVLVGDVYEKTSAANAGVKPGDRLVSWDGQPINDVRHWMELMGKHKPGDVVRVGVVRDGIDIELYVTLLAREQAG